MSINLMIVKDNLLDMTELFQLRISKRRWVGYFEPKHYWADIGNKEDFENARKEYRIQTINKSSFVYVTFRISRV
jgi:NDP-sugar pyrophosphorylase family protein